MPINAPTGSPTRTRRIAAFQKELDDAGKPKILTAQGSIGSKAVDPAKPKPADRPAIHRLAYMTAATQRELDRLNGKRPAPAATPMAKTPAAPARAKTAPPPPARPASSKQRAMATPTPPASTPQASTSTTTRTVSAVSFASLADALGIDKPRLGELMASGIVPREQFCTPDGAIYWEASAVPQIIETVVKHRASKASSTATAKPVPRPARAAPARPKVTFGPLMTDLPNMCRQLKVTAELLRTLIAAGIVPRGTPANSGNSEIYWPAADFKNIAQSVKRHLAASKQV